MSDEFLPQAVCPLCRSGASPLKFVKDSAPFYRCPRCSFQFARPRKNANLENTIDEFESSYVQYFEEAQRDEVNFGRLTAWMSAFCRLESVTLLDVGAGSGKFVRYLRRHGVEAVGLEPSSALFQRYLKGDSAFDGRRLSELVSDRPSPFSVVTAYDVIEHVDDPAETMDCMVRLLAPGGRLFISTPDVGCAHARLFGRHWHYYHRYHLSYWSRETLNRTATELGLRELYFGRRFRYQTAGYVLAYFWEHFIGLRAPALFRGLERIAFPVNLLDVMYLCFEKPRT